MKTLKTTVQITLFSGLATVVLLGQLYAAQQQTTPEPATNMSLPERPRTFQCDPEIKQTLFKSSAPWLAEVYACSSDKECVIVKIGSCCAFAAVNARYYCEVNQPRIQCRMICHKVAAQCVKGYCKVVENKFIKKMGHGI